MDEAEPEPLNLPPMTRRARLALLFGQRAQMPWMLSAGLLLFAVMTLPATLTQYLAFRQPTATAPGEITYVEEVQRRWRSGRYSQSRMRTAYLHTYHFEIGGRSYRGEYEGWHRLDDDITVEYVIDAPRTCRIDGVESGMVPWLVTLAALASLVFSLGVTTQRWRRLRRLAWRIHDDLSRPPPYRGFGKFPTLRLDRSGQLVAWGTGWLMIWPVSSVTTAAIVLDRVLF